MVERCLAMGFALAGVCRAAPSARREAYQSWIAAGRHGSMEYLARNVEERLDPARLLPGVVSIIMVADLYESRGIRVDAESGRADSTAVRPPPAQSGRVARYARGDDYHVVMKERLHALCDGLRVDHPGSAFRAFVDTAPVLEREHAVRAGLGWIGKHTLLIHPRLGSWMLLGGVLTTLELAPPPERAPVEDHCGACTRCIDACPTQAIGPYSVDGSRCISYLTIERRGTIDPALAPLIGDRIFGCDVCQEVCPHNSARPAPAGPPPIREEYAARRPALDPRAVAAWSPSDRARELSGSAMKRATLDMLKRNAAIVLENLGRT